MGTRGRGIQNRNIDLAWETEMDTQLIIPTSITATALAGAYSGDPAYGEFNSLGFTGVLAGAEGDAIAAYYPWPSHRDATKPMYSRVHFGYTAASAQAITFKLHYQAQTRAAAGSVSSLTSISYTARTTAATANQVNWTEWKLHNPGTWARDNVYIFALECDDYDSASADQVYIFGLEWKFQRSLSY